MNTQNTPDARPRSRAAFTLIELLVVIAVMAILASLLFPVTKAINKQKVLKRASAELAELETAITAYQGKLGHYPPDQRAIPYQNQLYYELVGTKLDSSGNYTTLDGATTIASSTLPGLFGASGFVNSSKGGGTDEGPAAQQFSRLTQGRSMLVNSTNGAGAFMAFGSALAGPGMLGANGVAGKAINPWWYVSSSPTNNPGSYDLWLDVYVGKTVYRISNWSKQAVIAP